MKLRVVMLDTLPTVVALVHENEHQPYRRRLVTIELTPEQAALLHPRVTGKLNGKDQHEVIGEVWLEDEEE